MDINSNKDLAESLENEFDSAEIQRILDKIIENLEENECN